MKNLSKETNLKNILKAIRDNVNLFFKSSKIKRVKIESGEFKGFKQRMVKQGHFYFSQYTKGKNVTITVGYSDPDRIIVRVGNFKSMDFYLSSDPDAMGRAVIQAHIEASKLSGSVGYNVMAEDIYEIGEKLALSGDAHTDTQGFDTFFHEVDADFDIAYFPKQQYVSYISTPTDPNKIEWIVTVAKVDSEYGFICDDYSVVQDIHKIFLDEAKIKGVA